MNCWRSVNGKHDFNPDAVVSTDTAADGEVVRAAQDAVTLSLTSVEAVVAAS